MALQSSGQISLNDMNVEAGGTTGTLININAAAIRDMISKGAGTQMSFSEWYGASSGPTLPSTQTVIKSSAVGGTGVSNNSFTVYDSNNMMFVNSTQVYYTTNGGSTWNASTPNYHFNNIQSAAVMATPDRLLLLGKSRYGRSQLRGVNNYDISSMPADVNAGLVFLGAIQNQPAGFESGWAEQNNSDGTFWFRDGAYNSGKLYKMTAAQATSGSYPLSASLAGTAGNYTAYTHIRQKNGFGVYGSNIVVPGSDSSDNFTISYSTNGGSSFTTTGSLLSAQAGTPFFGSQSAAICPSTGDFYAIISEGADANDSSTFGHSYLFKSTNNGASWTGYNLKTINGGAWSNYHVVDIAIRSDGVIGLVFLIRDASANVGLSEIAFTDGSLSSWTTFTSSQAQASLAVAYTGDFFYERTPAAFNGASTVNINVHKLTQGIHFRY